MYAFSAARPGPQGRRTASIIITRERPPALAGFRKYAATLSAYAGELPGYELLSQNAATVNRTDLVDVGFRWTEDDHWVRHRMVFLKTGLRTVTRFNASAEAGDFDTHAATFQVVLDDLLDRRVG